MSMNNLNMIYFTDGPHFSIVSSYAQSTSSCVMLLYVLHMRHEAGYFDVIMAMLKILYLLMMSYKKRN